METLIKREPQEVDVDKDCSEESKSSAIDSGAESRPFRGTDDTRISEACTGTQPQSLVMQESPLLADRSALLARYPEFRALQSQVAHLRIENEELRRQLNRLIRRGDQPAPAELKWLLYFREPAMKAQVLAVVREGLVALFAKDPSFRGRECATFWVVQERPSWQAFRVDYLGHKIATFRATMKAAHADAQLPDGEVRTTQPPYVALYRQLPQLPPLFSGTLEELAGALHDGMHIFM